MNSYRFTRNRLFGNGAPDLEEFRIMDVRHGVRFLRKQRVDYGEQSSNVCGMGPAVFGLAPFRALGLTCLYEDGSAVLS